MQKASSLEPLLVFIVAHDFDRLSSALYIRVPGSVRRSRSMSVG